MTDRMVLVDEMGSHETGWAIKRAQPVEGACWMCGAIPGYQHSKDCSGFPRTVPERTDSGAS